MKRRRTRGGGGDEEEQDEESRYIPHYPAPPRYPKKKMLDCDKVRLKNMQENPDYITIATIYDNPLTGIASAYGDDKDSNEHIIVPPRRHFDSLSLMPTFMAFVPGGTVDQERQQLFTREADTAK